MRFREQPENNRQFHHPHLRSNTIPSCKLNLTKDIIKPIKKGDTEEREKQGATPQPVVQMRVHSEWSPFHQRSFTSSPKDGL
ncbi:hypothetical protein JTE90_027223 [Oedothorax gibbosus]|uniref:Uncharacterized protein n=1 Tax=Oedothorax gibbosus TaxID=931172 RepID=A0AAV6U333_9ARAC|nr:hypothetical protein JTE90_027223 [Oedothorax gibbosus]